jgi:bacterioferritin-associated ferredoxin
MLRKLMLGWGATMLLATAAFAADVKVSGLHNCCPGCAKGVQETLDKAGAKDVKLNGKEVSFTADDAMKAQMAVRALFQAGYAGKAEGARTPGIPRNAQQLKGKELKITGLHNCCGACTKAINEALAPLGKTELKARETECVLKSDNEIEAPKVIEALRAAGYNGRVSAP